MTAFTQISGIAAPLLRPNIDTDVIIRIERLTSVPKDKLGEYAFEAIRYLPDGTPDPEFLPGLPRFSNATILITGINFGCGSSRESAVWALQSMGIKCVIAPSFGDIFFNNCFQCGVLPIVLDEAKVDGLARQAMAGKELTVDLEKQVIVVEGELHPFKVDPLRRAMLLEGLDEVGATLLEDSLILAWQKADKGRRPWVWQVADSRDPVSTLIGKSSC